MQIMTSILWHRDWPGADSAVPAQLGVIQPKPGQRRTAWLCEAELDVEAGRPLLWVPPHSEANGWDNQPSEIESSLLVTGQVQRPQSERGARDAAGYTPAEIDIESAIPLLRQCGLATSPAREALDPHWQDVSWSGSAEVGGFIYLSAVSGEKQLQAILKRRAQSITVYFQEVRLDEWSKCTLDCWILDDRLTSLFSRLLHGAVVLSDRATPYFA